MSVATTLPRHLRPRREKVFGDGRPRPLDRNAKARIMHLARALMHRTEPGKETQAGRGREARGVLKHVGRPNNEGRRRGSEAGRRILHRYRHYFE